MNGGKEFTQDIMNDILNSINANGIKRNFCILGGEPLCQENLFLTRLLINVVKDTYPEIKIYLWTGYIYEDLIKIKDSQLTYILENIDCLIDGPYIEELRDTTLSMRGSSNQRILYLK